MQRFRFVLSLQISLMALAGGLPCAAAAEFPPITDEERSLTAVPGEPNAPAVVLFKKGELLMMGYGLRTKTAASLLRVQARVKILTEAGIGGGGEISVAHSDFTRLNHFEGRTVLPDGRIIPVPADARFVRKTSESRKTFVTAVAFPSVQVGAILDYQYELSFRSPFYLEPWFFSEEIPVRYSEIAYKTDDEWRMRPWSRSPFGVKIQQEQKREALRGDVLRAWAENLPAVPNDPYAPPFADLATQMMLLPAGLRNARFTEYSLSSWGSVKNLVERVYLDVRRKDDGVAPLARQIAGSGTVRQKAEALYRFVRDEVETEPDPGIVPAADATLRGVLAERRGRPIEKALLLQAMLKAVKIESSLIWAADRNQGAVDVALPHPNWFDTALVALDVEGERVFLDPASRAAGFGQLGAGYEGTTAVKLDIGSHPEIFDLPEAPFHQNGRHAEIDLSLDEKGRLSGTGVLRLTGHHAAEKIGWQGDDARTEQAWKDWLTGQYRDFQISDFEVVETPDERRVAVTWSMAQREEEVLGDEVSLVPSAPLGPLTQPFVQPSSSRRTMVMFDFAGRDEVELRLRWPASWKVETQPGPAALQNTVGTIDAGVELADGSLVYRRRLDLTRRILKSPREYEQAQSLFAQVEKSDAQKLLLVRR